MASNQGKKDAYERYINGFDNPVGSVMEFDESVGRSKNKYSSDLLDRHAGQFSPNNPILKQLAVATNNQDIDALYEQAVNWETNYAILQEQREYDLPENEIARQRDAGINVDLTGSGSGGIGSGNAQMTPVQGQTKFSNSYDNSATVFDGINTAANMVSTFTAGIGTIIDGYTKLRRLPSELKLNAAQEKLGLAQANEINELLSGKKENIAGANILQSLQATEGITSQLANLSNLISPDAGKEGIISSLQSLGLSDDENQLNSFADIIGQFHKNPEMREKFAKSSVRAAYAEEEQEQITPEFISSITRRALMVQDLQQDMEVDFAQLQGRVMSNLNTVKNSNNISGAISDSLDLSHQQLDFDIEQFKRDRDIYFANIEIAAKQISDNNRKIEQIKAIAGKDGQLRSTELLWIYALENQNGQLATLGSKQLHQVHRLRYQADKVNYLNQARLDSATGIVLPALMNDDYAEYNMEDVINGTVSVSQIKDKWSDSILGYFTNKINPLK